MVFSNLEQEESWIKGWEDLDDLMVKNPSCYLLVPGYLEVTLAEAQRWIQNAAYESTSVVFKTEYYKGVNSILINKVHV